MTEERGLTQGARETEHRLTLVERDYIHIRELFENKLESIDSTLKAVKDDVGRVNGSIAQAIRDRDADREEIRRTQSLVADSQQDIVNLQNEVGALLEARAQNHEDEIEDRGVKKGRLQVLTLQGKAVAIGFSLGGGSAGIVAIIAYILEWRPI